MDVIKEQSVQAANQKLGPGYYMCDLCYSLKNLDFIGKLLGLDKGTFLSGFVKSINLVPFRATVEFYTVESEYFIDAHHAQLWNIPGWNILFLSISRLWNIPWWNIPRLHILRICEIFQGCGNCVTVKFMKY